MKKIFLGILLATQIGLVSADVTPLKVENKDFDVLLKDAHQKEYGSNFEFVITQKKDKTVRAVALQDASGLVEKLIINGNFLSVIHLNIGADNSQYWYHLIDLKSAKETPFKSTDDGMDNMSVSPDERWIAFNEYIHRRYFSGDSIYPVMHDHVKLIHLTESGPKLIDMIENDENAVFWLVKSNYLWTSDDKSIFFLTRNSDPNEGSDLSTSLSLMKVDVAESGTLKVVSKPLNLLNLYKENKISIDSFMADDAAYINKNQNLKISWINQNQLAIDLWDSRERKFNHRCNLPRF